MISFSQRISLVAIASLSVFSYTAYASLDTPEPPTGYPSGGLFMTYWNNLVSTTKCSAGEAVTDFSDQGTSFSRPLCEIIASQLLGGGMVGTLNYLAKYTPDGEHIGASSVYETSDGKVGLGKTDPDFILDSAEDVSLNGVQVGRGGGSMTTNTAVGANALFSNTTGGSNVALGSSALFGNTIGSSNIAVGASAGFTLTTGSNNIFIGANTAPNIGVTASNQLNIGNWIYGNTGKIGIGVKDPISKLHLSGSLFIGDGSGGRGTGPGNGFLSQLPFSNHGDANVLWFGSYNGTPGSDFGVIYADQTRIGSTVPYVGQYTLNIITGDNLQGSTTEDDAVFIGNVSSTTKRGLIVKGGNVGINIPNPTQQLEVGGNILATAYLYSSDQRLKKDVTPLSDSLEKILSLSGYTFTWKLSDQKDMGLIAQEVEKVFPEIVHTASGAEGYKSVEYGNLIAPVIESIKTLAKTNDSQDEQIAKLLEVVEKQQEEITDLKKQVEALEK